MEGSLYMTFVLMLSSKVCYTQTWISKVNEWAIFQLFASVLKVSMQDKCYYALAFIITNATAFLLVNLRDQADTRIRIYEGRIRRGK